MDFKNYIKLFSGSIIFSALLICCQQKKSHTNQESRLINSFESVVVDLSQVKQTHSPILLSAFAETIEYILLDDNPLINDISYSPIRATKDNFYIDGENIYKYDKQGNFIKKLFTVGGGPKEAKKYRNSPAAFNYDDEYCTFLKADGNTYISYSFNGEYLGEELAWESESEKTQFRAYFQNNQIFSYRRMGQIKKNEKVNILGPYLFYVKNTITDSIIYRYPNSAFDEEATYRGVSMEIGEEMFYINMDSLFWFKHRVIDTMYITSDFKHIYPKYIFNLNSSFMDIRSYIHFRVGDMSKTEFDTKIWLGGMIPLPNSGLLYTINNKIGMFDHTGKVSGYTEKPVQNDLDQYLKTIDLAPIIDENTFALHQGYLYILVDAFRFFEEDCQSPFPTLNEESNPVIVKIKLKQ